MNAPHTSSHQKEGRQVKESRTLVSYGAVSPVHPRGCDQKLSPARKGSGQRRKGSPAPSASGTGAHFQPSTLPAWPTPAIPDPSLPPWATWRYISLQMRPICSRKASCGRRHLHGDSGIFIPCPQSIHRLRTGRAWAAASWPHPLPHRALSYKELVLTRMALTAHPFLRDRLPSTKTVLSSTEAEGWIRPPPRPHRTFMPETGDQ